MARNKSNIILQGFSGSLGNQLVVRNRDGETYLSSKPKFKRGRKPTVPQQSVRMKFRESIVYAKAAIADPALKLDYEAMARPGQTAFNVAFSDAYIGPEVSNIQAVGYSGKAGQVITVRAIDNYVVTKVRFTLSDAEGFVLEEGEAVQLSNGVDWSYTSTFENATLAGTVIRVVAEDMARNQTVLEKVL